MADSVLVCRGCCCGTETKHPGQDHVGQLEALRRALPAGGKLWTVGCLGPCERSNVVVVRRGDVRRWFGEIEPGPRTDDLAEWVAGGPLSSSLARREFRPDDAPSLPAVPITGDLADVVEARTRGGGTWTAGVVGATAEVPVRGLAVHRDGDRITADGGGGDGRVVLTVDRPGARGFDVGGLLVLAVPNRHRGPEVLTVIGADEAGATLVDLGLGRIVRVCVRVEDPSLLDVLRALAGRPWREALGVAGPHLPASSAQTVVLTPVGRVEVRAPNFPAGDPPAGSARADLRPGELELGRDAPVGLVLPEGLVPVAFHRR